MSQLNDSKQRPPGLGALMVARHVLMLAAMLAVMPRRGDHYGYRRPARGAVFSVARHCSTGLRSARRSMAKEA
jgi:hypothetical protein